MKQALMIVPGLASDAVCWQHQLDHLADRADMIVADLRACSCRAEMADAVLQLAAAFAFLAVAHTAEWQVYVTMALAGLGMGLAFSAMTNLIVDAVPSTHTGVLFAVPATVRATVQGWHSSRRCGGSGPPQAGGAPSAARMRPSGQGAWSATTVGGHGSTTGLRTGPVRGYTGRLRRCGRARRGPMALFSDGPQVADESVGRRDGAA